MGKYTRAIQNGIKHKQSIEQWHNEVVSKLIQDGVSHGTVNEKLTFEVGPEEHNRENEYLVHIHYTVSDDSKERDLRKEIQEYVQEQQRKTGGW